MTIMTTELARTPLHDWHVAHGGRMVDFAGWLMPVQYTSIVEEHQATRNAVGVFDISHMGRLAFLGASAAAFLDSIDTRRVVDLKPNQIRYGLLCNENGGILDDVLVYGSEGNGRPYTMVVNAGNREKIVSWLGHRLALWNDRIGQTDTVTFHDETDEYAMFAVQGPKTLQVLQPIFQRHSDVHPPVDLSRLRYYQFVRRQGMLVSRTGYTGEDGFELICQADHAAVEIWEHLIQESEKVGGMAAGLGARDTLRLEAAMPLYGHELSEAINPIQAGLQFAVNLAGREFVGREAIERFAADPNQPARVGLTLDGRRVPRQGCAVLHNGETVGEVTSGTFSPTFQRPIAMAYVRPTAKASGIQLEVDIRGTRQPAAVVPLPFYQREKK
jgi:aminomethyltransferase